MKNTRLTCAIDLDGVIADFDSKIHEICGAESHKVNKGFMWSSIKKYNDHTPFFRSLKMMDDAKELLEFVFENFENVMILSAHGTVPADAPEQKKAWVAQHINESIVVHCVPKSPDKAQFASPTTILIDDRTKSITPWLEAGGIGILHKSAKDTIKELKEYLIKE